MNNMGTKEFSKLNKIINTMYGDLMYLTDEDMEEINIVDNNIMDIDRTLKNYLMNNGALDNFQLKEWTDLIWGKESKVSQYADIGQGLLKIFSAIADIGGYKANNTFHTSDKEKCLKLVQKRRSFTEQRNNIISGAKDRMRINDPNTYKLMTNQLKDIQLQFSRGEFDLSKLLMPNM